MHSLVTIAFSINLQPDLLQMKYHISIFYLLLSFGLLTSCYDPSDTMEMDPDFVSTRSLIKDQYDILYGKKLNKTVVWNGESSSQVLMIDSLLLVTELDKFLDLDLNADAIRGGYKKERQDQSISFERKSSEKRGPLLVTFEKSAKGLSVTGKLLEETFLYSKGVNLKLEFSQAGQLKSYHIHGMQKMAFSDEVLYEISGKISD